MFFLAVAVTKVGTCLITIKTQRKQTHVKLTCIQSWLALALPSSYHQASATSTSAQLAPELWKFPCIRYYLIISSYNT